MDYFAWFQNSLFKYYTILNCGPVPFILIKTRRKAGFSVPLKLHSICTFECKWREEINATKELIQSGSNRSYV